MKALLPEQEQALTQLKDNLHLPENGFHDLIIELCIKYQLPFQAVRTVLMKSQTSIESGIRNDFDSFSPTQITKAHWLSLIDAELANMAKNNVPIMEQIKSGKRYQKLNSLLAIESPDSHTKEDINNLLEDIYEFEVAKQLKAMLRTTKLYWSVKSSLFEMTELQREKFSDYPQYMEVIEHLLSLTD